MDRITIEKGRSYHTAPLSNNRAKSSKFQLKKQDKPAPEAVLSMLAIRFQKQGARLQVFCPFHAGGKERNPSLAMDVKDGHYRCFTCGEKGGDVIAFYRAVTGVGFKEALKALGVSHA